MEYVLTQHAVRRMEQRQIDLRWIQLAMEFPDHVEQDKQDPQICLIRKKIDEKEGRVLRIAYNKTSKPARIVSVHFDRRWRNKL